MSKMSSEDLDKIFQQGSEQYDFQYNDAAWDHMESLLDKDKRRRGFWWWFGGFGILLIGFGLIYFSTSDGSSISKNGTTTSIETNSISKKQSDGTIQQESDDLESNNTINNNNTQSSTTNLNNSDDIKNQNSSTTERKNFTNNTTSRNSNKKAFDNTISKNDLFDYSKSSNENQITSSENSNDGANIDLAQFHLESRKDNSSNIENGKVPDSLSNSVKVVPLAMLNNLKIGYNTPGAPHLNFDTIAFTEFPKEEDDDEQKENSFIIGLLVASELSTIGRDDISKMEGKYGGFIEFRYRKKFSTSIGVNIIKKDYGAGEGDYDPSEYDWEYGIAPTSVKAHCDILEIPLKVGYFFNGHSEDGFYSNLGLTNYLMLEERYYYKYDVELPNQRKNWMGNNESNHWLGVGTVEFGYQKTLGPKFSIQVAPYTQFPIVKIGHGNVNLWSFGISSKLNFHVK